MSLASCAKSPEAKSLPNVIVILADDLGYGDMGAYGATGLSTPNLDMLANNGVRFTDGHATSATSTPSRYALFTGAYPWKNPRAKILAGDAPLLIGTDQFTMPKMFRAAGYKTAAIGKWHLGMGDGKPDWNKPVVPGANDIGFDYSFLIAATVDRVPTVYVEDCKVVGLDPNDPLEVSYTQNFGTQPTAITNPELMTTLKWAHGHNNTVHNGIPRIGYMKGGNAARWVDEDMADCFVDKVKDYIEENKNEPFFLYYGLHQPHVPRTPHSRFVGATTQGPRGDAIVEADWCVGELIAKLEKEGILENTIIFFSSDNGAVLNDGYIDGAAELLGDHKPNGPFRGGKYSLFEGGTRVPFFIYWKGHIQPRVSDALISQLDLLASFAEIIDQPVPGGLDTENHLDLFMGKPGEGREDFIVEATGRMAFRKGGYALVPPFTGEERNETGNELGIVKDFTLYDLKSDPTQMKDVTKAKPELLEQMKKEFISQTKGYYNPDTVVDALQ